MTPNREHFPYVEVDPTLGIAGSMPYLPLTLEYQGSISTVSALVDSGSALNVIPYDVGRELGAIWERQTVRVPLSGVLAESEARAILLSATIGGFSPVRFAFAWSRSNSVPVILGQVNFFLEFDVCFRRTQLVFEIQPKGDHKRKR